MRILAISGSARRGSSNTGLLRALAAVARKGMVVDVFDCIGDLPVFSPDLEGPERPAGVRAFQRRIAESDGILISSPEYVRNIPGGLKNAIDWLVSGDEIVGKPIALAHASHRGDDMLTALRTVLSTVSSGFNETLFFRLPVMKETPEAIRARLDRPEDRQAAERFLEDFAAFCRNRQRTGPSP
ncbi:NADPH-dependent FMN reductase [Ciceribacter sp. L1K22]|uniref:NADPH-dependent FMN reductase n=1 Tax=Ciceribacter sp. L1K22 TaxID=2820275 RepID=UPI001ABEDCF8|nr:NADPH-dependent FMN reductase [Ciceribacter sp. L1K22]MBO3761098.1 NAD(P)H-dependent oxidoreductase [Ciceribacter sp. L1K22]